MREQHRLGMLQMRKTGQNGPFVRLRLRNQRLLKGTDAVHQMKNLVAQIKPDVKVHLIVAAAGGMDTRAFVAEHFDQFGLDVHVNVFEFHLIFEVAGFDLSADLVKPGADRLRGRLRDNPGCAEHERMRLAAFDIVLI